MIPLLIELGRHLHQVGAIVDDTWQGLGASAIIVRNRVAEDVQSSQALG